MQQQISKDKKAWRIILLITGFSLMPIYIAQIVANVKFVTYVGFNLDSIISLYPFASLFSIIMVLLGCGQLKKGDTNAAIKKFKISNIIFLCLLIFPLESLLINITNLNDGRLLFIIFRNGFLISVYPIVFSLLKKKIPLDN